MANPKDVKKLIEDAGGQVVEMGALPDGSGFATATFRLPEDHWIYQVQPAGFQAPPPMGLRLPDYDPRRHELAAIVTEAVKYGYRAATMCGKDFDIDPDALIQNVMVGLFGYHTPTALSGDEWANPTPAAPYCQWYKIGATGLWPGDKMQWSSELLRDLPDDDVTVTVEVVEIRYEDDGTKTVIVRFVNTATIKALAAIDTTLT